jgi:hypothetical protein
LVPGLLFLQLWCYVSCKRVTNVLNYHGDRVRRVQFDFNAVLSVAVGLHGGRVPTLISYVLGRDGCEHSSKLRLGLTHGCRNSHRHGCPRRQVHFCIVSECNQTGRRWSGKRGSSRSKKLVEACMGEQWELVIICRTELAVVWKTCCALEFRRELLDGGLLWRHPFT